MRPTRRHLILGFLASAIAMPAWAEAPGILSAPEAHEAAANGTIPLIDIRTPSEWDETGVPENAFAINMISPGFVRDLDAALDGDRSKPFAMICATGGRTRFMASALRKLGFTSPLDVSEGMMGSGAGPGWLARKLPVRRVE